MHFRRFALATLALIAVSPAVADRTPRQRASLTPRQHPSVIDTTEPSAEKIAKPFEVAEISRGGKGVVAFTSQSASILMGLILALNSGFMNGCALGGSVTADGSSQAVAAVTASWTNSALGLAAGNSGKFGFLAKVLGSFIFGSAIAGYLEPNPTLFSVSSKNYAAPLAVAAGLVLLAINKLGELGNVKMGFYLLAMANGINNSVTSTMTSNLCRTSHFTGISSDMGTFIGQILRGNKANLFKLKVFAGLAAAFWSGGYLSYGIAKSHGLSSLYASVFIYLFMAFGYDKVAKSVF